MADHVGRVDRPGPRVRAAGTPGAGDGRPLCLHAGRVWGLRRVLVAWGYWITLWAGNAAVAVALSGYLAYFVPLLREQPVAGLGAALGAIWLVTWVNVRGVKEAGVFQVVTTALKLVPLVLIALVGLAFVEPSHFTPWNTSQHGTF